MLSSVVDLGGGFGAPSARLGDRPNLKEVGPAVELCLDEHFPGWREGTPRIVFESGRFLVGCAGTLVCSVLDVKNRDSRVVVLDSGINHYGGMSGLGRVLPVEVEVLTQSPNAFERTCLVGPLCSSLDVLNRSATLAGVVPGDLVAVPNVGAYGLTASLVAFLSHGAPVEVVVHEDDGRVEASRLVLVHTDAT